MYQCLLFFSQLVKAQSLKELLDVTSFPEAPELLLVDRFCFIWITLHWMIPSDNLMIVCFIYSTAELLLYLQVGLRVIGLSLIIEVVKFMMTLKKFVKKLKLKLNEKLAVTRFVFHTRSSAICNFSGNFKSPDYSQNVISKCC